jgi:hypothetical protein
VHPSSSTPSFRLGSSRRSVPAGFTGLSFQYTSNQAVNLTVFDQPNGTGAVLATRTVPRIGMWHYDFAYCGDPNGIMGVWRNYSLPFWGVAKSIRFSGPVEYIYLDDMTIVQDALPSCTRTIYWLWDLQSPYARR